LRRDARLSHRELVNLHDDDLYWDQLRDEKRMGDQMMDDRMKMVD
jgi:hypothetical protein